MKCYMCGAWTRVLNTRGTLRRRECANMHRFTTREQVVDQPNTVGITKKENNRER